MQMSNITVRREEESFNCDCTWRDIWEAGKVLFLDQGGVCLRIIYQGIHLFHIVFCISALFYNKKVHNANSYKYI